MTTTDSHPTVETVPDRRSRWVLFGLGNLILITALAVASWYLLVDPEWSPLSGYPQPYTALLFWSVLGLVGLGSNQEFTAFARFRQPVKGLFTVAAAIVFAVVVTYGLSHFWGSIDPSFAGGREDGLGYFTGGLWVLFGFVVYLMSVVNWAHWPSSLTGLAQPWLGAAQIVVLIIPTTALYLIFGLPSVATWVEPGSALLDTSTVIGVFFSIVVSILMTGVLAENWPWKLAGSATRTALAATVGNAVLGIGLYFFLQAVARVTLGSDVGQLGATLPSYSAQIGICWVFCMLFWANCFGNKPTNGSVAQNVVARILITFILGVLTFLAYYYFVADVVLHEPAVTDRMNGNALGWFDWWLIWMMIYALCFESPGLGKLKP
ncbi:hypothetical protein [Rhodococcoides fascians]|uniref:hypothetical protein n=1 Tax=Rhodococcoides fascians TaxID=1828 RepID=UPI00050C82FE|nr:hypothetical protein [Rhodococcus fascians]